jgi:hypothetical protein
MVDDSAALRLLAGRAGGRRRGEEQRRFAIFLLFFGFVGFVFVFVFFCFVLSSLSPPFSDCRWGLGDRSPGHRRGPGEGDTSIKYRNCIFYSVAPGRGFSNQTSNSI